MEVLKALCAKGLLGVPIGGSLQCIKIVFVTATLNSHSEPPLKMSGGIQVGIWRRTIADAEVHLRLKLKSQIEGFPFVDTKDEARLEFGLNF